MSTYRLVLRTDKKANRYGQYAIEWQYLHGQGARAKFSTGVHARPEDFNADNPDQPISRKVAGYSTLNTKVQLKKEEIMTVVRHLIIRQEDPNPNLVKGTHRKQQEKTVVKPISQSLNDWGTDWIQAMRSLRGKQTLKNYSVLLTNLKLYQKQNGNVKPEQLTKNWNLKWLQWLGDNRNMKENSVGAANKNLRQFCKWLSEQGGVSIPSDWEKFPVYSSPPEIFYLEASELDQFYHADLSQYPGMARARDLFCFQARTGQRISDLKRTQEFMIIDGSIRMRAHKNRAWLVIPLTSITREIWERYEGKLPFESEQRYNRALKDALKHADISRTVEKVTYRAGDKIYEQFPLWSVITNHDAIKTFANNGLAQGMTVQDLATITGKTMKTLQRSYLGKSSAEAASQRMKLAFGN